MLIPAISAYEKLTLVIGSLVGTSIVLEVVPQAHKHKHNGNNIIFLILIIIQSSRYI